MCRLSSPPGALEQGALLFSAEVQEKQGLSVPGGTGGWRRRRRCRRRNKVPKCGLSYPDDKPNKNAYKCRNNQQHTTSMSRIPANFKQIQTVGKCIFIMENMVKQLHH